MLKLLSLCLLLSLLLVECSAQRSFGTAISRKSVSCDEETEIFAYNVSATATFASMTHFWITADTNDIDNVLVRLYLDGEDKASIVFEPALACGVGFQDEASPWGTKWIGHGAEIGAWYINYRIPFQTSIRITLQLQPTIPTMLYYTIVRGVENVPIVIGTFTLPSTARMTLHTLKDFVAPPLAFVSLINLPTGRGLVFQQSLSILNTEMTFLEGCFYLYTPYNASFPGMLLSSGTEDYFDSAYYFDSGEYRLPVSGFTHLNATDGRVEFSAYRFHEMDPLFFEDGVRLEWRNGDMEDPPTTRKCLTRTGGNVIGNPSDSKINYYGWVYTW